MRVSEVYASVQGEGPRTGQTTVFVRFGGCNLRCPGWPCDTQHAIDPAFRKEWIQHDTSELLKRTKSVARLAGARVITLTGGEPFLQNHQALQEYVEALHQDDYTVEAFTNGTLRYPEWATEGVSMIMDWKLPGSGEEPLHAMRFENLSALAASTQPDRHATKFVCKSLQDIRVAHSLWSLHLKEGPLQVYYGKVWEGDISDAALAEYVMANKLPWKLNVQLHNYIWDPQERGR